MAAFERTRDDLPVIRAAFPYTIRLVSTARLRDSVLAPLIDNDNDLAALAKIEGATSARLVAEDRGSVGLTADEMVYGVPHARFITANSAYAKPRQPNRFNGSERGALCAALAVETCIAEVGFHLTQALADAGNFYAVVDYAEMLACMSGEFVDLRPTATHPAQNADTASGYQAGNALSAAARAAGLNGIVYPSVRHDGGTCIGALRPHVIQSVTQGDVIRLSWHGECNSMFRVPKRTVNTNKAVIPYSLGQVWELPLVHTCSMAMPQRPNETLDDRLVLNRVVRSERAQASNALGDGCHRQRGARLKSAARKGTSLNT